MQPVVRETVERQPERPARLSALNEAELFTVPAPEWEVEKRTEQGGLNVIIGPRSTYKTFLIAALLLALTRIGASWFGAPALRIGPVMFVPLEDLRGWRQRWQATRRAAGIPDDDGLPIYTWPHSVNLFSGQGFGALLAEVERLRILHVVFDPWVDAITGADENTQRDVGIALGRLKELRRNGRSVTVVHHTGLDESRERGSTVLGGAADTMMLMKREDSNGAVIVECTKMRNGERFPPIRLHFDKAALALKAASIGIAPLPQRQRTVLDALQVLATNSGAGVKVRDWQERCVQGEGVSRRWFFASKAELLKSGKVVEHDGLFVPV